MVQRNHKELQGHIHSGTNRGLAGDPIARMKVLQGLEYLIDASENGVVENYSQTICHFGKYTMGLTGEEVEEFIQKITGKKHVKRLLKKYNKAFGRGHTCAVMECKGCKQREVVFYHCDILKALREIGLL